MGDRRLFRSGRARATDPTQSVDPDEQPVMEAEVPAETPQVDVSTTRAPKTMEGVISAVSLGSRGDAPALEVVLVGADVDTGEEVQVTLVWLGRTQISGIHPGREVVATARICDEAGSRVMYNPRYDLR